MNEIVSMVLHLVLAAIHEGRFNPSDYIIEKKMVRRFTMAFLMLFLVGITMSILMIFGYQLGVDIQDSAMVRFAFWTWSATFGIGVLTCLIRVFEKPREVTIYTRRLPYSRQ